jgi:hypothetical protein
MDRELRPVMINVPVPLAQVRGKRPGHIGDTRFRRDRRVEVLVSTRN